MSESLYFKGHLLIEFVSQVTESQLNGNVLCMNAATALLKRLGCFEKEASPPREDCADLLRERVTTSSQWAMDCIMRQRIIPSA